MSMWNSRPRPRASRARVARDGSWSAFGPAELGALSVLANRALAFLGLDEPARAAADIRAVIDARTRVLGPDDPETLEARSILVTCLDMSGLPLEAIAEQRLLVADLSVARVPAALS
jgi:hypothetical protein